MLFDRAFAPREYGVIVLQSNDETVLALEFNEFLGRIASGAVQAEDIVVGRVFTDGRRKRVGALRLYAMIRSGAVPTEDLPRRAPGGVLAAGQAARTMLRAIE